MWKHCVQSNVMCTWKNTVSLSTQQVYRVKYSCYTSSLSVQHSLYDNLYSYRFYGVAVARRDTDGCPANLGLTYTTIGPYTQGSTAYITAAWSRKLPMILADNDVPPTLIIGSDTMTIATRPEGNEQEYTNQGLSPAARYCVFIVTQQNTSIPGVSTTLLLLL